MSLARGEGGGVCPRVAAVPKSQSELIPERAGYGECDSGLISSMTPAGRNKTVSFIPFLVGSTVASILVLAVVVAIVIARSGGSDVALVSPVAACCDGFDDLRGGAPGFFSSSRSLYEGIYAKNGAAK